MANSFKNPSGAYYLKQLFYETAFTDREHVIMTLKDEDHEGSFVNEHGELEVRTYPSLRRLYLEMADESEYLFATKYFGGWPHWTRLLNCTWFVDYLQPIREELAVRNAAIALNEIRESAKKGNVSSSKYLLEGNWRPKEAVGRPSKEKIKREAEKLFKSGKEIDDDLERIQAELDSKSYAP